MKAKARIVKIGNSRGIRIPKTLLDEASLSDEVEVHAQPGRLVIQAVRWPRSGWATAAKRMRARGDDRLLEEPTATTFDLEGRSGGRLPGDRRGQVPSRQLHLRHATTRKSSREIKRSYIILRVRVIARRQTIESK
jgi:antitoxin MazE